MEDGSLEKCSNLLPFGDGGANSTGNSVQFLIGFLETEPICPEGKPASYWFWVGHSPLLLYLSMDNLSNKYPISKHLACALLSGKPKLRYTLSVIHIALLNIKPFHLPVAPEGSGLRWRVGDRFWSCCQLHFTNEEESLDNLSDSPKVTQLISGKIFFDVLNRTLATHKKRMNHFPNEFCVL